MRILMGFMAFLVASVAYASRPTMITCDLYDGDWFLGGSELTLYYDSRSGDSFNGPSVTTPSGLTCTSKYINHFGSFKITEVKLTSEAREVVKTGREQKMTASFSDGLAILADNCTCQLY